jgi:hypothetical protein
MWKLRQNRRSLRRSLEVEQDFKQRQLTWVLGFAGLYVVVSSLMLGAFYVQLLHTAAAGAPPLSIGFEDSLEIWNRMPGLRRAVTLWATALTGLSVLFATAVGLVWTHKMGGPVYRFKAELERIRDGQPIRKITLRHGDEFQDVAAALNATLETIEARERDLRLQLQVSDRPEGLEQLCEAQRSIRERLAAFDLQGLCATDAERVALLLEELQAIVAKGEA